MDLRQFLLDAPETCFYTCYDLILNAADGVKYHLAEYLEIGEVADISAGGCSLEMINGNSSTFILKRYNVCILIWRVQRGSFIYLLCRYLCRCKV
jgi:hypothetical protein